MRQFPAVDLPPYRYPLHAPTPTEDACQGDVEACASLGAAVAAFNVYAAGCPFCDVVRVNLSPLGSNRAVVILSDQAAYKVTSNYRL